MWMEGERDAEEGREMSQVIYESNYNDAAAGGTTLINPYVSFFINPNGSADPNSRNFDQRTLLHIASAEGLHLVADIVTEFGADVLPKDRWGNTPLDEGQRCTSEPLIKILENARVNLQLASL